MIVQLRVVCKLYHCLSKTAVTLQSRVHNSTFQEKPFPFYQNTQVSHLRPTEAPGVSDSPRQRPGSTVKESTAADRQEKGDDPSSRGLMSSRITSLNEGGRGVWIMHPDQNADLQAHPFCRRFA